MQALPRSTTCGFVAGSRGSREVSCGTGISWSDAQLKEQLKELAHIVKASRMECQPKFTKRVVYIYVIRSSNHDVSRTFKASQRPDIRSRMRR